MLELRQHLKVLAGAVLGTSVNVLALFYYSSSVFFDALREDVGWTLQQLSWVYVAFAITSAIALPVAGATLDRFGSRGPIGFSFIAMAVCFASLGALPAKLSLYFALHVMLAAFGSAATSVGFSRIVSARFDQARGAALGLVIAGSGITAAIAPVALGVVVRTLGWHAGYFALAGVAAILGGISLLLAVPGTRVSGIAVSRAVHEMAAYKALLQRREFWLLLTAFAVGSIFGGGYVAHFISLLRSKGADFSTASMIASVLGFGLLVGRLASGWLMDRIPAALVGVGTMVLFSAGLLLLLEADRPLMMLAAVLIGFGLGSELDLLAYLVSRYFPARHFGKTYGLLYGLAIGASAFSPLVIAYLASGRQGYDRALEVCCVGMLSAGGLLLLAARCTNQPAHTGSPVNASTET